MMIVIFTVVILTLVTVVFQRTSQNVQVTSRRVNDQAAIRVAEAGIEKAVWCLNNPGNTTDCPRTGGQYLGESNVALGGGTFTTTVSGNGSTRTVTATGALTGSGGATTKQIRAKLGTTTTNVAFFYGVQVGEGGIEMDNNAEIVGNVQSNGSIISENNGRVRGTVIVSGGTALGPDQQQAVQSSDFTVGQTTAATDAAQSFRAGDTNFLNRVSLYIKKVGSPSNATVRIVADNAGNPHDDEIARGTLNASLVTGSYGWIDVTLNTNPPLQQNTTYWIVLDASRNSGNYWIWGKHDNSGYGNGVGQYSEDWDNDPWNDANGDFGFKTWMGGVNTKIQNLTVPWTSGSSVHANTIIGSTISTNVKCKTMMNGATVAGNVMCGSISGATISGNVTTETIANATISGSLTCNSWAAPLTGGNPRNCPAAPSVVAPSDPPPENMPISQANIDEWESFAQAGGTIAGDYTVTSNLSLGPKEIAGNLVMTDNNRTLTVTGTIYVRGNIDVNNGSTIRCAAAYGADSCVIVTDGWIHIANNSAFSGSGQSGSFVMLLTTLACDGTSPVNCTHHDGAVDVHNNATGVIFYASRGMINLHNGVNLTEATAYKLRLDNEAVITYNQGLQNTNFASGPGAAWVYQPGSYQIIN